MRSSKRSPGGRRQVFLMKGRKIRIRQSLCLVNDSAAERKLRQLQRMVPADCSEINMETLFQRTAHYISLLEAKVCLLQNLSSFYGV